MHYYFVPTLRITPRFTSVQNLNAQVRKIWTTYQEYLSYSYDTGILILNFCLLVFEHKQANAHHNEKDTEIFGHWIALGSNQNTQDHHRDGLYRFTQDLQERKSLNYHTEWRVEQTFLRRNQIYEISCLNYKSNFCNNTFLVKIY